MVIQSAQNLSKAVDALSVVVNGKDEALFLLLQKHGFDTLISPNCERGMGHSLADAVVATNAADGWLVALADMPYISPATIACVANQFRESDSICAPYYQGARGHPVAFPARYGEALARLTGDAGARSLLKANSGMVRQIDVDDAHILTDVDTPGDVIRI